MESEYTKVSNFRKRAKIVVSLLKEIPCFNIIEIGARNCEMLEFIRAEINGIKKIVAVDIDEKCLEKCQSKGFHTINADLNIDALPFESNSFDIAIATEIIEHLHHPYYIIGELRRILKDNGRLIVTIPNIARLRNRLALLFGRDPLKVESPERKDTHIREFTRNSIITLLQYHGFDVIQSGYIKFPGGNPFFSLIKTLLPKLRLHIYCVAVPCKNSEK